MNFFTLFLYSVMFARINFNLANKPSANLLQWCRARISKMRYHWRFFAHSMFMYKKYYMSKCRTVETKKNINHHYIN